MRIVNWNCCMAYRKKRAIVDLLQPDLLILQEVARADLLALNTHDAHWAGRLGFKGLGVASFAPVPFAIDATYNPELPWFIPLRLGDLHILATWACAINSRRRYVRLMHEAIDHYRDFLDHPTAMLIGDFNSNQTFDRKYRSDNHTAMVEKLAGLDMTSLYHRAANEIHGSESIPTYFQYRRLTMPYHFDFAFATEPIASHASIAIGTPGTWLMLSDHMPLIIDIDFDVR